MFSWIFGSKSKPKQGQRKRFKLGERDYDHLFHIVLIGDVGVGKASFQRRFMGEELEFPVVWGNTPGVDFTKKTIDLDGLKTNILLWDLMGAERFRTITSTYYRGAHGFLLFYDITNEKSLRNLRYRIVDIEEKAPNAKYKLLVGTKSDLAVERRAVTYVTAKEFADEYNMKIVETSAKDDINVEEAVILLCAEIKKALEDEEEEEEGQS